jgi:D-alanyl-D-alanine carboxypeptidase
MIRHKNIHHVKKVDVEVKHLYLSSVLIFFCLIVIIFLRQPLTTAATLTQPSLKNENKQVQMISPFNKEAFLELSLNAHAYVVYDIVGEEVVASSHPDDRVPLASITKVMTSLTALSLGKSKEEVFQVEDATVEDGYDLGLQKDQKWKLEELLKYMLIFSSNDAALTVASHYGGKDAFVNTMNTLATTYGLTSTFTDPAGRDMDGKIGGLGTALDAAKLFVLAKTIAPNLLDATTKKRQSVFPLTGKLTGIPNTNQEIENLPGAEGSKTGYTDLAGGNLGVVVDITVGRPVVLVVLGSTRDGRFEDIATLYRALKKSLEPFPIKEGR